MRISTVRMSPRLVAVAPETRIVRPGSPFHVATWKGLPGRTMRVSGATATSRGDIRTVELRTAEGTVVLRLSV